MFVRFRTFFVKVSMKNDRHGCQIIIVFRETLITPLPILEADRDGLSLDGSRLCVPNLNFWKLFFFQLPSIRHAPPIFHVLSSVWSTRIERGACRFVAATSNWFVTMLHLYDDRRDLVVDSCFVPVSNRLRNTTSLEWELVVPWRSSLACPHRSEHHPRTNEQNGGIGVNSTEFLDLITEPHPNSFGSQHLTASIWTT